MRYFIVTEDQSLFGYGEETAPSPVLAVSKLQDKLKVTYLTPSVVGQHAPGLFDDPTYNALRKLWQALHKPLPTTKQEVIALLRTCWLTTAEQQAGGGPFTDTELDQIADLYLTKVGISGTGGAGNWSSWLRRNWPYLAAGTLIAVGAVYYWRVRG